MTGHEYRDLVAAYIHRVYGGFGLSVYTEIALGKTIIGKDRKIDIFVVRAGDRARFAPDHAALAIECKYQDAQGTTDEKIPYSLEDLEALWVPGCLCYAGEGWSRGILHTLEASKRAAFCLPYPDSELHEPETRQLDHFLAATFGLWELVLPEARRFSVTQRTPRVPRSRRSARDKP